MASLELVKKNLFSPHNPRKLGKRWVPKFYEEFNKFDDDFEFVSKTRRRKAFQEEIEKVTASNVRAFLQFSLLLLLLLPLHLGVWSCCCCCCCCTQVTYYTHLPLRPYLQLNKLFSGFLPPSFFSFPSLPLGLSHSLFTVSPPPSLSQCFNSFSFSVSH